MRPLARVFLRRPALSAVGSGVVMFTWGLGVLRLDLWFCGVIGALMAGLQWALWRRGGWARKREERIHDLFRRREAP